MCLNYNVAAASISHAFNKCSKKVQLGRLEQVDFLAG